MSSSSRETAPRCDRAIYIYLAPELWLDVFGVCKTRAPRACASVMRAFMYMHACVYVRARACMSTRQKAWTYVRLQVFDIRAQVGIWEFVWVFLLNRRIFSAGATSRVSGMEGENLFSMETTKAIKKNSATHTNCFLSASFNPNPVTTRFCKLPIPEDVRILRSNVRVRETKGII